MQVWKVGGFSHFALDRQHFDCFDHLNFFTVSNSFNIDVITLPSMKEKL